MTAKEIRTAFLDFFNSKQHKIIPSAPMVVKNDPSLMFTNAGMNQFKDIFLGNQTPVSGRVANYQKCLRVSGKHNDLEEVGRDTYHHTMFEMLGNWSFGDYFKEEAIAWAWEFLIEVMGLPASRLYATVFEGDPEDRLEWDEEAWNCWDRKIEKSHLLKASKKDNFWEMGETGPCGPCSEIHIDLRPENDRKTKDGRDLINAGHPLVIELWNLVFIQYNRKADGSLEPLPKKHIDTGLGLERLAMAVQGKESNYDTDIFISLIREISRLTGIIYNINGDKDIAMRVISDHLRAVSFSIADGQLPSNNKAGYVIRRILRRAVRYAYTFLGQSQPLMFKLVDTLCRIMGESYPELLLQKDLIEKVIREEEISFLRTLETGMGLLDRLAEKSVSEVNKQIDGKSAFELYDTFGFPLDLTELILREKGLSVDVPGFEKEMLLQKNRSRDDAAIFTEDWQEVIPVGETVFTGYDQLQTKIRIARYRKIQTKGKTLFHLVFNNTPFYAESGGQTGDTGYIENGNEKTSIKGTIKENNLIIHLSEDLPEYLSAEFSAVVNPGLRNDTARNHTATHLMHHALREILGSHVEQKGSLVHPEYLRFDFSHFQKLSDEEIIKIEKLVNRQIRANLPLEEYRSVDRDDAMRMGALALFGEKYGEQVRVIRFGDSIELCGGTHVKASGEIGLFRIIRESAIAAGIRRIEALTGAGAEDFLRDQSTVLQSLEKLLKSRNLINSLEKILEENSELKKRQEEFSDQLRTIASKNLENKIRKLGQINMLAEEIQVASSEEIRNLSFEMKTRVPNLLLVLGAEIKGKALLGLMISENLVKDLGLDARQIIREISPEINGGGGGQDFYATAGGKDPSGLPAAIKKAVGLFEKALR